MDERTNGIAYLICGTPRTGSTLLCDLLESTGIAGHPQSYFRQADEATWARRWGLAADPGGAVDHGVFFRAAITAGSTPNGVFGARVMWGTLDQMVAKLGVARPDLVGRDLHLLSSVFGPVRFCHLRRADTLAQAVSWARAEQTGYWHAGDTAAREPRFDVAQIDRLMHTIEDHNAAWRGWFGAFHVRPHVVSYEDLVADRRRVVRGLLHFLGLEVPADGPVHSRHGRQADCLSAEWIGRYRAASTR